MKLRKLLGTIALAGLCALAHAQQPVRIGSTLALTGPLSATGAVHKVAGEIYVEELNKRGGLLGRKVEWVLKDDQSRPDLARTLYEQLITVDKVDLLIGPYATANIVAAVGVAQRYNKIIWHHTAGVPSLLNYDLQFPTGGLPADPGVSLPELVFDAVAHAPRPPKTVAIVTSKFPSVHFISVGARDVAKKRGLQEVAWLEWEFGNRDFGAIAARVKEANPDFLFIGAIGVESLLLVDALRKIDYTPPLHFHMFPAPGPLAKAPAGQHALALTTFEQHPPFTNNPVAAAFVKTYNERAAKAGLPDNQVELQAAGSFATWQTIEAAVNGAKSIDDKALAAWLKKNPVDTIIGTLRWETPSNYMPGAKLYKVKQLQEARWLVVWPPEFAAPGAKLLAP
ncbi:MAG TPA: amino acid ABC transporter substrate-binding protein [Burkholderiales bacterium]|nr:amino acid ABC transporter substrate-binding protein [Burkholderiales bacterium]